MLKILNNIKNKFLYKFDEFKFNHKILASLTFFKLEGAKVKVYYTFKKKGLNKPEFFYIEDVHLQSIKLDKKDETIIYEVLGVYNYMQKYGKINEISSFLEGINHEL